MHTAGMRLYTAHGTVLYFDKKIGELRHGPLGGSPDNARILLDGSHARFLGSERLAALSFASVKVRDGVYYFKSSNSLLSAEPNGTVSITAVPHCTPSEQFMLLPTAFPNADEFGVHRTIHEDDYLFHHIRSAAPNIDPASEYFADGRRSAVTLHDILVNDLGFHPDRQFSLLDFASGYGLVARHYPRVLPSADVTTCDIHAAANSFNNANIGIATLQSALLPEDFKPGNKFDVVFALSFFSHISDEFFARWLTKLYSLVDDNGFLIFTTHGQVALGKSLGEDDNHFTPYSEQKDLETKYYGVSYVSPIYVFKLLCQMPTYEAPPSRIALFREGFWWSFQDLYVLAKRSR